MRARSSSSAYIAELDAFRETFASWQKLANKTIAVSGATGMIGSYLIDLIMRENDVADINCNVIALGRNEERAKTRLPYFGRSDFAFEEIDVSRVGAVPTKKADFVIHLASSTHPRAYASDPIGTINGNVRGLDNLLSYSKANNARLLFASSVEIYGENRGDTEYFEESYCGYIDCNTLRACYTEAKRLGEAMCQAYREQEGLDVVIARIARVYGPTLLPNDSKALSQFILRSVDGKDVVLKSEGLQRFSYLYVGDVVTGILSILLDGACGEAYNLADRASDVKLRELAAEVADAGGVKVTFDVPDAQESAGYSKASVALMDATKARALGWMPLFDIRAGIASTLAMLREWDER